MYCTYLTRIYLANYLYIYIYIHIQEHRLHRAPNTLNTIAHDHEESS